MYKSGIMQGRGEHEKGKEKRKEKGMQNRQVTHENL